MQDYSKSGNLRLEVGMRSYSITQSARDLPIDIIRHTSGLRILRNGSLYHIKATETV
jgi:hypothetical protein